MTLLLTKSSYLKLIIFLYFWWHRILENKSYYPILSKQQIFEENIATKNYFKYQHISSYLIYFVMRFVCFLYFVLRINRWIQCMLHRFCDVFQYLISDYWKLIFPNQMCRLAMQIHRNKTTVVLTFSKMHVT